MFQPGKPHKKEDVPVRTLHAQHNKDLMSRSTWSAVLLILFSMAKMAGPAHADNQPTRKPAVKKTGSAEAAKADPKKIWQGNQGEKMLVWNGPILVSQYTVGAGRTLHIKPPSNLKGELSSPRLLVQGKLIIGDPDKQVENLLNLPLFLVLGLTIELDGVNAELVVNGVEWKRLYGMNDQSVVLLKKGSITIRNSVINGQGFMIEKNWTGNVGIDKTVFCGTDQRITAQFSAKSTWGSLKKNVLFQNCVLSENYRFDLPLIGCMKECDVLARHSFNASSLAIPTGGYDGPLLVYLKDSGSLEEVRMQVKEKYRNCEVEGAEKPFNRLEFRTSP